VNAIPNGRVAAPIEGARLLERDGALRTIAGALGTARSGGGGFVLIEGHAGMGKTRLVDAALEQAHSIGITALRVTCSELERNLSFGIAERLVKALLAELPPRRRTALLRKAPALVRPLLEGGAARPAAKQPAAIEQSDAPDDKSPPSAGDAATLAQAHALFTVTAEALEGEPALVAVDDLHWCDQASLEFLLYLSNRLDELPAAMLGTRRTGVAEQPVDVLERLAALAHIRVERLAPLTRSAVGVLVGRALGERADEAVIEACAHMTGGNPFYLRELLLALDDGRGLGPSELAERARTLAPEAVIRAVRTRVGRLGRPVAALAGAAAILGDDVPLRHAAKLAGLTLKQAAAAADALAAADVLAAEEPLRFVHPLVRRAVYRDLPAFARAERHLEAARLLDAERADPERVAAHLLLGGCHQDEWVVGRLRAAGASALAHGSPQSAVNYLQRALEEPPAADRRIDVLAELGAAEIAAGEAAAAAHLAQAIEACDDVRRRSQLSLMLGGALSARGLHEQAAEAYDAGIAELGGHITGPERAETERELLELHDTLQAGFLASASLVPALHGRHAERTASVLAQLDNEPRTHGQRLLLAHEAVRRALAAEPIDRVLEVVDGAWEGGRLFDRRRDAGLGTYLVSGVLTHIGELERSIEVADAALEHARRRFSPLQFATASFLRSLPYYLQGQVSHALADLELARDARRYGWRQFARIAAAAYALCLIEADELQRAHWVLSEENADGPADLETAQLLYAWSELHLAQQQPQQALASALACQQAIGSEPHMVGIASPWRTAAAQALLQLGKRQRALELASDELDIARRRGVPHAQIRALRVSGLCQQGRKQIESLREAVELGADDPPRLETIHALVELGAALRRSNQRTAARQPLRRAADLAHHGGARALYAIALVELQAAGARPRREGLLSGPLSLTPSEHRIAALAAAGQSNREIARALFVTPKTVEYHLRNTYRKLDIDKRDELVSALES
jgi:DNA-binding CsgD family transcriptional regulator